MLIVLASRYFVLYDVDDRCAWLVDGVSALLHLLRASIKHLQNHRLLRQLFCFNGDEFEEPKQPYTGSDAAFEVLSNMNNRTLPLYSGPQESWRERTFKHGTKAEDVLKQKTSMVCVEDRVERLCDVLGQIVAHHDDVSTEAGVGFRLKLTPRRQLEGFDFMDLAAGEGTLWPKTATLHAAGAGWVDFTRAIHAITLFGTGFGDLFQPEGDPCGRCLSNEPLPKEKDYLAATIPEIQEILKKKGSTRANPWRLVDKIYWHNPDKLFEPCQCTDSPGAQHDRVQVLLPATFPKLWSRGLQSPTTLPTDGAVIFGHSWKFPLRWHARGDPVEGEPEASTDALEEKFHDSGIDTGSHPSVHGSSSSSGIYSLENRQFLFQGGHG